MHMISKIDEIGAIFTDIWNFYNTVRITNGLNLAGKPGDHGLSGRHDGD